MFRGSLAQNLHIVSLALTSTTFISAMTYLILVITFILAISVGLIRALRTLAGKAKVLSTLLGICGAMLLTFYKNPTLHFGGFVGRWKLILLCNLIDHSDERERYPCPYSSTTLMSTMGSIQSIVYAIWIERDRSQRKLRLNIRLFTASYSEILNSGVMVALIAWCVRVKGSLLVLVFNPLILVFVAIDDLLLLKEKLHME
ncbi:hypothetical protein RJ641_018974, partial [Dillenia turbinata]